MRIQRFAVVLLGITLALLLLTTMGGIPAMAQDPNTSATLTSIVFEDTFDTFTFAYRGTNYYGSRGNPLTHKEYAWGSGSAGSLLKQQVLTYLHDSDSNYLAKNIVKRVNNAQTQDAGGTKIAEVIVTYDSTTLTSVTGVTHHDTTNFGTGYTLRGNPTVTQNWESGSTYLSTTFSYDITGQVRTRTDPNGNATNFSYTDAYYSDNGSNPPATYSPTPPTTNAHLTLTTRASGNTLSYGYYYGSGKPAVSKEENNQTTYTHFQDVLNRPTKKYTPGGFWVQNEFTTATHTKHTAPGSFLDEHDTSGLGQPTAGILSSDPSGTTRSDTTYDTSGRVQSVTNPYRGSPSGSNSMLYDGLNRVTKLTLADGNYQEAFFGSNVGTGGGITSQLCSTATYGVGYPQLYKDEAGKKRQQWLDALGRLIEADEPDATGALSLGTCHKYDLLGNLKEVNQGTQTRTNVYDGMGRLTARTSPEGGTEYL